MSQPPPPLPPDALGQVSEGSLVGATLQGRYEIVAKRGVGGMSTVYQARDRRFVGVERWCAVKEMINAAPDAGTRQLNMNNFEREANILASLNHPAIPKVYDFFNQSQKIYLVLEFIDGVDLEQLWAETRRPLPPAQVIRWTLQVCDVLSYLHDRTPSIVFRDVKPSNLMLSRQHDRIMLVDFGIARNFQAGVKGTMIGTEGYAPPEQYRGLADVRGDLYALGATLHHLLTGQDPRAEAPFTFHERPIQAVNPAVPPELERAIMKALEYDPDDRYANTREMSLALAGASVGASVGGGSLTAPISATAQIRADAPQVVWRFRCEDEVRSSPRIVEDLLYIGSYDHNLYALEVRSGRFVWKYPTEGGVSSTPCVAGEVVYVGSEDGGLYALDRKTGKLRWSARTEGPIRSSPRVVMGMVMIGSDDCTIYGFHEADGKQAWRFPAEQAVRSSPLVVGDTMLIGSDDGNVYCLRIADGRYRWKYRAGRFVISTPCFHDGMAIFGAGDSAVHAIDARASVPVWRTRVGGAVVSSPVVVDSVVFIGAADGVFYALDARNGRILWKIAAGGQIVSTPAVSGGAVYFGNTEGKVQSIDAKGGKPRWVFPTEGTITSSPVVQDGRVYIGSADHWVYALPA